MTARLGLPEWLSLLFFSTFLVLAWLRPLDRTHRRNASALGAIAIGLVLLTNSELLLWTRSFMPLLLMPMAYWQTGQFTAPINEKFQRYLAVIDRKIFNAVGHRSLPEGLRRAFHGFLEYSYLFVYPMVPSALAVLYGAGAGAYAREFWSVVLPPTYICYATLPFLRTLPPRSIEIVAARKVNPAGIRGFNMVVVRHVTHQSNTFPSGHAAAAMAVALVLMRFVPPAGVLYLLLAISIMAGAFFGRYHYAADVLLGAALAVFSFMAFSR
ncbi:MAG TPA: phosphatase PAP2 family protein [Terriglobia bacterium]|nr:phosphatase PAP2 family protein [Terriglobia bacterium]